MTKLAEAVNQAVERKAAKPMHKVKVLIFDIETMPHEVYTWGLWGQNVAIGQIIQPGHVMGFSYKWVGKAKTEFISDHTMTHQEMVEKAHELFTEADVVVTYNGISFDIPHMQREFLLAGLNPPKPYKQIDLLRVCRKQFNFASNKLDFVTQQLGLGRKTSHEGFDLWVKCLNNDEKAWRKMGIYANQDVKLTEKLYHYLLPWLTQVPHMGQLSGLDNTCWACGGTKLRRDGQAHAFVTSYKLYECLNCHAWVRTTEKMQNVTHTRQQKIN